MCPLKAGKEQIIQRKLISHGQFNTWPPTLIWESMTFSSLYIWVTVALKQTLFEKQ